MIDEVDRRLIQLEMEKLSLRKETRADALKRVEQIDDEMMELQEKQVKHLFSNQLFATRKLCWRRSPTSAGVPYKSIYTCVTGGRYMSLQRFFTCRTNVQEALTNTWDLERGRVGKVQALKEKLDALKVEIEHAERAYDLNKAAELTYAVMPKLQVRFVKTQNASLTAVMRSSGRRFFRNLHSVQARNC